MKCGSILLRLSILKSAPASSGAGTGAGAAAPPPAAAAAYAEVELEALQALVNLTQDGRLVLPGLEDRIVQSLSNVSFAGATPVGDLYEALANGAVITAGTQKGPAPSNPPALAADTSTSKGAAANTEAGGGGGGGGAAVLGAAVGASVGGIVAAAALAGLIYVRRRRRRAEARDSGVGTGISAVHTLSNRFHYFTK
eukprot:tig00021108_g18289.t1